MSDWPCILFFVYLHICRTLVLLQCYFNICSTSTFTREVGSRVRDSPFSLNGMPEKMSLSGFSSCSLTIAVPDASATGGDFYFLLIDVVVNSRGKSCNQCDSNNSNGTGKSGKQRPRTLRPKIMKVVFPEPEGPSMATNSFSRKDRLIPFSASCLFSPEP